MPEEIQDLVIIGGGIMGLCTAYYASQFSNNIVILEKATIGPENQQAASFSLTRSIRNDYLDPLYAQLAYEARRLWLQLQHRATESFLIECGCLNIARADVTPDLDATYAEQSYRVLNNLHLRTEAFTRDTLRQRFRNSRPIWDAWMWRPAFSTSPRLHARCLPRCVRMACAYTSASRSARSGSSMAGSTLTAARAH